jgi:hypothetical protein
MGKARICDVCSQVVQGQRKIVRLVDADESKPSNMAKVYKSIDMHDSCLKQVTDFIEELKKGAK